MITGVYEGNSPSDFLAAQRWSGNEFTAVSVHTGGANWNDFVSSVGWEVNLWKSTAAQKLWTVPLIANGADLHSAATGAYDQYYVAAAKALAASSSSGPIYVRTGWEFNGDWEPWAAAGKTADYIGAYRDFVAAFRTVSNRFVFTWAPNVAGGGMNPATAYPGDDVVDIIGMDFYWKPQYDGADPTNAWNTYVTEKYGLSWLEKFAAQHGKPTAYPEWGIQTDNAAPYIAQAAAWFKSHNVVYETYWDSNADYAGKISDNSKPNSGAAFIKAFSLPNGEVDTVAADGSVIKRFPLDGIQGFTTREDHYTAAGILTSRVFFDKTGTAVRTDTVKPDGSYTSHAVASPGSAFSSSDTTFSSTGVILSRVYYDAAGHASETDTYQATGAYLAHVTGVSGQPYASYDATHAPDGSITSTTYYLSNGSIWTPPVMTSQSPTTSSVPPAPQASGSNPVVIATPSVSTSTNAVTAVASQIEGATSGASDAAIVHTTLAALAAGAIPTLTAQSVLDISDLDYASFSYQRLGQTLSIAGQSLTLAHPVTGRLAANADETGGVALSVANHDPGLGDLNGDGHSDILWRNSQTGVVSVWNVTGNVHADQLHPNTYVNGQVGTDWTLEGTLDFNHDGAADLLWRNETTGVLSLWTSTGSGFTPNAYVDGTVGTNWQIAAIGDFNGDGADDLLWRDKASGVLTVWDATNAGFAKNVVIDTSQGPSNHIVAVGDFNGDGKSDVLWRADDGTVSEWLSNGAGFTHDAYVNTSVDKTWHVEAAADFNGDGKSDILWRNDSGTFTIWESTGSGFTPNTYVDRSVGSDWTIAQVGDFNGDGKADILWRHDDGAFTVWQSNGHGFDQNVLVNGSVGSTWTPVTTHYDFV